jgi:hypothetical protein
MAFTAQVICDGIGCNETVKFKDDSFLVHDLRTDLKNTGWLINRLTVQDFCPECAAPFRNAIKNNTPLEVRHGHH